jgi:GNAT superfamily N-acetyltransferase
VGALWSEPHLVRLAKLGQVELSEADARVVVEQVRPEVTYGLRAEVLRPGLPPVRARFDGDAAPTALHFAAYDVYDRIVGVVAVLPEPFSGTGTGTATPDEPGWRLRGMAVRADRHRTGVGRALLVRVFDGVARLGGELLWCNARLPAVPFYAAAGFVGVGDHWQDPEFGPHVRMRRTITRSDLLEAVDRPSR